MSCDESLSSERFHEYVVMAFKKKRKVGEDETEEHTSKQEARQVALADMPSDAHQVRRKSKAGLKRLYG